MDDLDRLAFRLMRTVRSSYPHLMTQEFTLTDLEERLVPFRDARREMSNNGPEAWEITLLRMLSGERDYVTTNADLQLACRQALSLSSPTLALVRPWSSTTVRVGQGAVKLGIERAQATPTFRDDAAMGSVFSAKTLRLATPASSTGIKVVKSAAMNGAPAAEPRRTSNSILTTCGCRFCGGKLPDARKVTFCPHCGVNLTVRQCPACSTELDVNWRYCVTCGRGSEVPELPESITNIPGAAAG